MRTGRAVAVLALLGALFFALQGGEYGTLDWLQLRREEAEERERVAQLRQIVDSLERAAIAIERDPRVQERVAREAFGMIRRGEFLYKLVPSEAADHDGSARPR